MSNRSHSPIRTARLYIRETRPKEDAKDVLEFVSMPSALTYTTRSPYSDVQSVEAFMADKSSSPHQYYCSVILRLPETHKTTTVTDDDKDDNEPVNGKVIGLMGSSQFPSIGYIFHPNYSGRGYATEALQAFVQKLFSIMPSPSAEYRVAEKSDSEPGGAFDYVKAGVDLDNGPSIRLLKRCGFTRGEVMKEAYLNQRLGRRDAFAFRLARPGMRLEDVCDELKNGGGKSENVLKAVPDVA